MRKITRGMNSFDTFTDTLAFNLVPALLVVIGVTVTFIWRWPILGAVVGASILVFIAVSVALSRVAVAASPRDDQKLGR